MDQLIQKLVKTATAKNITIATAESCTGGLLGSAITAIAGASDIFEYGFITYANKAKTELLGVPEALLSTHGAVSAEVAIAMAEGARKKANSTMALSITGIAGPDGGSEEKPVGTVFIGLATEKATTAEKCFFVGNRQEVREQTVAKAVEVMTTKI